MSLKPASGVAGKVCTCPHIPDADMVVVRGEQDQAVCAIPAWGSLVPGMGTGKSTTMSVVICVAGLVCAYT